MSGVHLDRSTISRLKTIYSSIGSEVEVINELSKNLLEYKVSSHKQLNEQSGYEAIL